MRSTLLNIALVAALLAGAAAAAEAGWQEGVAAFKAANFSQAAREFQAVVDERPDWPGGHYMLGQTLLKLDRNQEALSELRKAYDLNPNDDSIRLSLAMAFIANSRYRDAGVLLQQIDESKLSKPQQAARHQMLALALSKSGQSDQVLGALAKAALANPNDSDAQFQYGTALLKNGDTDAAIRALERAARLDSKDPVKQRTYIQALLRKGRESRGSAKVQTYEKAAEAARRLVASQPSYEHFLLLGEAQLGATDYQQAVSTFRQALSKNGNDWLPYFYIGQAHTALKSYPQAETSLKQALDRTNASRDQIRIWRQLGFVYEKQKAYSQAKSAYQRAGDAASVERVAENQRIEEYNRQVEEENRRIQELEEERRKIEEELKDLPGGPPPSF